MPDETTTPKKPTGVTPLVGLTKRQQVDKANRTIFIWVAVAGAVLALSLVLLQFLVKEAIFNQKLISAKQETSRTLEQNIENAPKLKQNVDALLANTALAPLRANPEDSTLQVILDALPTTGDTTTFSNSLYNKVLQRSGVNVTAVTVGVDTGGTAIAPVTTTTEPAQDSAAPTPQILPYSVTIQGNQTQIKSTLTNLENVIRPINNKKMLITVANGSLLVTLSGETYFLPRSTVELGMKPITP